MTRTTEKIAEPFPDAFSTFGYTYVREPVGFAPRNHRARLGEPFVDLGAAGLHPLTRVDVRHHGGPEAALS